MPFLNYLLNRIAPKWTDIDLLSVPTDLLPRICVVDVKQNPLDFIYRYWGTDITNMHMYDLTGKSIQDLTPPSYANCLMEQYKYVYENAKPSGYLTEIPLDAGYFTYYAVIQLPLSSDGKIIDGIISAEEYGVTSFVYRARQPFIPEKILAVLNGEMPGVIRAKGHFWIATRPEWVAEFSLAGALSSVKPIGTWWASVPKDRWPDHASARDYMQQHWVEPWGDRRQELVFIGAGIDWPALKARLDACLVPAVLAAGPDALPLDMPDPFPGWRRVEDAA